MLEMLSLYSCLGVDQTVSIQIKSRERLILITHNLRASLHQEYAVLARNTWVIRCLKEGETKREKISKVNIYASKMFWIKNKAIFKDTPPHPLPFLGRYTK